MAKSPEELLQEARELINATPCSPEDLQQGFGSISEAINILIQYCCNPAEKCLDPKLNPCCNYFGIIVSINNVNLGIEIGTTEYVVNIYDFAGAYVTQANAISWQECEFEVGEIVGVHTDENCLVAIVADPCNEKHQCCTSGSVSSSAGPSSSVSGSTSLPSTSSSGGGPTTSSLEPGSSSTGSESGDLCCDLSTFSCYQNPYDYIQHWDDPNATEIDEGSPLMEISWTLSKAGGTWSDGQTATATMTFENTSDREIVLNNFKFDFDPTEGQFSPVSGNYNLTNVTVASGGTTSIDAVIQYNAPSADVCCVLPPKFNISSSCLNFPIGTVIRTSGFAYERFLFGGWTSQILTVPPDPNCEPSCFDIDENFAPLVNSPSVICANTLVAISMDYPPYGGGAVGENPSIFLLEATPGTNGNGRRDAGICTSASSPVGTIYSWPDAAGIGLINVPEGENGLVTANVQVKTCLNPDPSPLPIQLEVEANWDRDWFLSNTYVNQ